MFPLIQPWEPSEADTPADHWSKSAEYLAERAERAKTEPWLNKPPRAVTTHESFQDHFRVKWVPDTPDATAPVTPVAPNSTDTLLEESKKFRDSLKPVADAPAEPTWIIEKREAYQKAERNLISAVQEMLKHTKLDNIVYIVTHVAEV
jgi:hypothetical protein